MTVERWTSLIGMSGASDARLIEWAHSCSRPLSVEISGAEFDYAAFIGDYKGWCPRASHLALAPGLVDVVNLDRFHESAGGLIQRHLR